MYYGNLTVTYIYDANHSDSNHTERFEFQNEGSCKLADELRAAWSDLVCTWDGSWAIESEHHSNDYSSCTIIRATCDRADTMRGGNGPVSIEFTAVDGDWI